MKVNLSPVFRHSDDDCWSWRCDDLGRSGHRQVIAAADLRGRVCRYCSDKAKCASAHWRRQGIP